MGVPPRFEALSDPVRCFFLYHHFPSIAVVGIRSLRAYCRFCSALIAVVFLAEDPS